MNKFQRKESKAVRKMMAYYSIQFKLEADYKSMRRNMRKTLRFLTKANRKAHKEAIRGMDLANGRDQTAYIRQDLFNTICVAKPIEVKNE